MASESAIVARIKLALSQAGAKVIKIHGSPYMEVGTPDLIGCYRGRAFAFEVKKASDINPDPIQMKRLMEWSEAGAVCGVIFDVRGALDRLGIQ